MDTFRNSDGKPILQEMVKEIQGGKTYLGDVDGLIGDGDHGMNMNKGFSIFEKRFLGQALSFSEGLNELGMVLLNEIGGSMGPIYGTLFMGMSESLDESGRETYGLSELAAALEAGLNALYEIVDARVGDKTLVDTLAPALVSLRKSEADGEGLAAALEKMKAAAECGRDSTKDLVAKYGRSSRLGERSRGVLDAGSCSACIIVTAMANGIAGLL